jgi:hypothetical protein
MAQSSNSKRLIDKGRRTLKLNFSVHRIFESEKIERYLFDGMLLRLFAIGSCSIAVGAFIENEYRIVGLIPKGMIHHLEKILEEQDDYCIQIDCTNCSQLENAMWISIVSLGSLLDLDAA